MGSLCTKGKLSVMTAIKKKKKSKMPEVFCFFVLRFWVGVKVVIFRFWVYPIEMNGLTPQKI